MLFIFGFINKLIILWLLTIILSDWCMGVVANTPFLFCSEKFSVRMPYDLQLLGKQNGVFAVRSICFSFFFSEEITLKITCTVVVLYVPCMQKLLNVHDKTCMQISTFL